MARVTKAKQKHMITKYRAIPINKILLERNWHPNPNHASLSQNQQNFIRKYLNNSPNTTLLHIDTVYSVIKETFWMTLLMERVNNIVMDDV